MIESIMYIISLALAVCTLAVISSHRRVARNDRRVVFAGIASCIYIGIAAVMPTDIILEAPDESKYLILTWLLVVNVLCLSSTDFWVAQDEKEEN